MKNIFKRLKKTTTTATTKWVVSYSDTAIGYGEKIKTFTNETDARNYLEGLKEKSTDSTIEYFMYEIN